MNLDQLEAVITIVEKGSFRAAAEALHRSQPALSTSVKNLEEEFGLLIFDRAAYRPRLTEAGRRFSSGGPRDARLRSLHEPRRPRTGTQTRRDKTDRLDGPADF